jgi:hypothetical protein
MRWAELFDCLEFQQIARFDRDIVVPDRQPNLLAEPDPGLW